MSEEIVKTNGNGKGPVTLKSFLESPQVKNKLAEVASRFLKPEDLVRLALMAASRQPELLKCSHTSILRALMDAAALGIAPGGVMGRGYLVPRKNRKNGELEACFDPGWRGLCDIARRDKRVLKIDAKVVYEGDAFEYREGTEQTLIHQPVLDQEERGEIIAAYAIAKVDGEQQIEVLTRADIEKIRRTSMAQSGPWKDWPEEMARKSAVRRLCKYLPYSPTLERATEHSYEPDTGERTAPDPVPASKPRAQVLTERIRARTAAATLPTEPAPEPEPEQEEDPSEGLLT